MPKQPKNKTILIAPLNWGLGHATRCMPIIEYLLAINNRVILAGDGESLKLLSEQFPTLKKIELPSYNVKYGKGSMVKETLFLVPQYIKAIREEHKLLKTLVIEHAIDLIISDNRYGLWSDNVPSVFIGHQIAILPPKFFTWGRKTLFNLHMQFIKKFDALWIPDFKDEQNNLSGSLSHKYTFPMQTDYIGPLTRLKRTINQSEKSQKIDVTVILSGPEPQRTLLEQQIFKQIEQLLIKDVSEKNFLIVQGKPNIGCVRSGITNLRIKPYLNAKELNKVLLNTETIICRSGYSSIMDLAFLGKKQVILIPTQGQTEQEYLAKKLFEQKKVWVENQHTLNLERALIKVKDTRGFDQLDYNKQLLVDALENIKW